MVRARSSSVPRRASDRRVEELAIARALEPRAYIPLFGTAIVSSRRSTIRSDVMRSDSA